MDGLLLSHLDNVRASNSGSEKQKVKEEREISYSRRARAELSQKEDRIGQIQSAFSITQPKKKSRKALKKLVKAQTDSRTRIRSQSTKKKSKSKSD